MVSDDRLRVTVLGCAGSYPGPGAACSGYLVRGSGVNVAVDLGPGTLANLQRHIELGELDAVVLSHAHPDHWTDLAVLRTAWKYALGRTGLVVAGTAETRHRAEAVTADGLAPTLDWVTVADGSVLEVGPLRFDFSRTDHYVETLAVRVVASAGGPALAYSADTGPGWSFAAFGRPVALAVCEASHLADAEPLGILHLSARQAGSMCRAAGVEQVVLTHLVPGSDLDAARNEAAAAFGAPVEVATANTTYEVPL